VGAYFGPSMKHPVLHPILALLLAAAMLPVGACSVTREPLALDETLRPEDVDEIVILPVIDARPSQLDQVQIARNVGDATVRMLRERGYFVLEAEAFRQRPSGPLDLDVADAARLSPLAPEDSKFFLVVQVQRLDRQMAEAGETYDAQLAAVLVDRVNGRVVWRDVATASSTLSGVLTVFSRGSRQYEAAVNATRALVDTLPKKVAGEHGRS
jgi:hypothetical protein